MCAWTFFETDGGVNEGTPSGKGLGKMAPYLPCPGRHGAKNDLAVFK